MKNLKDLIKYYGFPGLSFGIAVYSYRITVYSHNQELTKQSAKHAEEITKLNANLFSEVIDDKKHQTKLVSKWSDWTETDSLLISYRDKLNLFNQQLDTNQYLPGQSKESCTFMKEYYLKEISQYEKIQAVHKEEFKILLLNIKNSDVFDWLWNWIENYRFFLSNLELDQIVAVINLIGNFMVLSAVISISIILAGNYLIKFFNVENIDWLFL